MHLRLFQALESGATLVTASGRLSLYLREQYDQLRQAEGDLAWRSPDILPLPAWLDRCWREWLYSGSAITPPPVLLNPYQEQAVWERVVEESPQAERLLQIPAAAAQARDAWNLLHDWALDLSADDWHNSEDTEAFLEWARRFDEIRGEQNWLPAALLPGFLVERIGRGFHPPEQIWLAGFEEITPRQRLLFDALRGAGSDVKEIQPDAPAAAGNAARVALNDAGHEILTAARWARRLLDSGVTGSIGIVVAGDLSGLRERIQRTFANVFHPAAVLPGERETPLAFNISLGLPLSDYPLVRTALLVLEGVHSRLPLAEAGVLLRSPFLSGACEEEGRRAQLDRELRGLQELELSLDAIERLARPAPDGHPPHAYACPQLAGRLRELIAARDALPKRALPGAWAARFSDLLRAAGWPGDRTPDSVEYQTVKSWNELLSKFAGLDAAAGPVSYSGALGTLRRMAARTVFQPESKREPVQILGVLETSGLQFDHLWVMGLHDGVWPSPPRPNPFLPMSLQRRHNLPHSSPEREYKFARMLTAKLESSGRSEAIFSHPKREQDYDLRPSPLIAAIPEITEDRLALPPAATLIDATHAVRGLEFLDDSQAPPPAERQRGGSRIFTEQAACPFRAFALLRLHAESLEGVQAGLSALDRGSLVHAVLQQVWNRLESQERLCSMPASELEALVRGVVTNTLASDISRRPALRGERFAAIEQDRLERLVLEWLEIEKQRPSFVVAQQERDRTVTIGGIEIRVRADRIDRLPDGRHLIIDYKTGEHGPAEWDGDRPDQPQLPLYAVTSEVVAGVAFAQLKTGKLQFRGLAAQDGLAPGVKPSEIPWEEQLQSWRTVLEKLAGDYLEGRAGVDPKDPARTCQYCELPTLCRISGAVRPADE